MTITNNDELAPVRANAKEVIQRMRDELVGQSSEIIAGKSGYGPEGAAQQLEYIADTLDEVRSVQRAAEKAYAPPPKKETEINND